MFLEHPDTSAGRVLLGGLKALERLPASSSKNPNSSEHGPLPYWVSHTETQPLVGGWVPANATDALMQAALTLRLPPASAGLRRGLGHVE
jgi:hypothetical protein